VYDGYPTGHGAELKEFLGPFEVVNGLSGDYKARKVANGAGCLAAQLIAHFKTEPGGIYLEPAGARDMGEEYIYTVRPSGDHIRLTVAAGAMTFFGLPGSKESSMTVLYDGPVGEFDPERATKTQEEAPAPKNDWVEQQDARAKKVKRAAARLT